jgi:hypothetical protein
LEEAERVWLKSGIELPLNKLNQEISMRTILKIIKIWLPLAVVTAGLCGLVYLTVQQSLRMGANDPQIQMAEDTASHLNAGAGVESVVPSTKVEITGSLAPFLMVFDDSGKILASSATLHTVVPAYPLGVLEYTRKNGQDRITWQPEVGVRMATVVVRYDKGFVLAGRSLREIEKRESQAEQLSGLAMLVIWVVTFIMIALGELIGRLKSD